MAHSSKTNPPDVGKYKPKFDSVWAQKRAASVRDEHQHIGMKRMQDMVEQQTHVCVKAVKGLNLPFNHPKSQSRRLAEINKRLEEQQRSHEKEGFKEGMDAEHEREEAKRAIMQEQVMFRKELREPMWTEAPKEKKLKPEPCHNYNRSYIPTGAQVAIKNLGDQERTIQRFFIDDWTRKGFGYETFFEGEVYHLVKKKDGTGLEIHTNHREPLQAQPASPARKFHGYSPRPDKTNPLNESRFDIINKDPNVSTHTRRISQVQFGKQLDRPKELFGKSHSGTFYDASKESTMKRLTSGIPKFEKVVSRPNVSTSRDNLAGVSCCDYEKAIEAKTVRTKPKKVNLTNIGKQVPRDEQIYRTDDRWVNQQLENTKGEREVEIKARI